MKASDQDQAGDLLIQEVDEDLRREQFLNLWKAYGKYAIAAIVAIVLGVAGHQIWQAQKERNFQTQAAAYQAAEALLAAGKSAEALAKLAELSADRQSSFAALAAFRHAQLQVESGDDAGAIKSYDALSQSDAPSTLRDLALLKGAMLSLDKDDPAALAQKLKRLADQANPFHCTAIELLAVLARRRGDQNEAVTYYQQLAGDAAAPQNTRARAAEMLTLLGVMPQAGKPEKG